MSTFVFNINTDASVVWANKLEKLHRSAFPLAISGTLNDTGFIMKKTNILKEAKSVFEERQKNFFKANSRVEPAKGFDINGMVATVGMVSSGLHNAATNYAVKDLEQQESGGTIKGRSFKPLPGARISGTGNVRANSRISQLLKAGNIIDARNSTTTGTGKSGKMQQFIKASIHAGVGGYVLGGRILWRVKSIKRVGRNIRFEKEKLYSFKKSGTATVTATGFMHKAAMDSQKEMEFLFRLNAQKQIERLLRK